jgi:glutathione synthase/RimK-type ligase-like ATP-grasp enzyme
VLTNERDFAADLVVSELGRRGAWVSRLNIESARTQPVAPWLPNSAAEVGRSVVWWRQFEIDEQPNDLAEAEDLLIDRAQWRTWLAAIRTPNSSWMNDLWAARRAENKIEQLRVASAVGFTVPHTVVTNDRTVAAGFRQEVGSAVVKTLSAGYYSWSNQSFVFTEVLDDSLLDRADYWNEVPIVVQQNLRGALDARVLSFGRHVFAAKCTSKGLDWRKTPFDPTLWSIWRLPQSVARLCLDYRAAFGLEFAAFDFMLAGDEVYFLEANQAGEWMFLERALDLRVSAALADRLIEMGGAE